MRIIKAILLIFISYASFSQGGINPKQLQPSEYENGVMLSKLSLNGKWYYQHDSLGSLLDSIFLRNDTIFLSKGRGFVDLSSYGSDGIGKIDSLYNIYDMSGINTLNPIAPWHVGNGTVTRSTTPKILITGDTETATAEHGFSDSYNITNGLSYNSYDARVRITADLNGVNGHYAGFQSIPEVATGINVSTVYNNYANAINDGTIDDYYGYYNLSPSNTDNAYGFYLNGSQTRPSTSSQNGVFVGNMTAPNANGLIVSGIYGSTNSYGLSISGIGGTGVRRPIYTRVADTNDETWVEFRNDGTALSRDILMLSRGSINVGTQSGMIWEAGSGATKYYSARISDEWKSGLSGDLVFHTNRAGGAGIGQLQEAARITSDGDIKVQGEVNFAQSLSSAEANSIYRNGDSLYYDNGVDVFNLLNGGESGIVDTFFAKNESLWKASGDTLLDFGEGVFLEYASAIGVDSIYRYVDSEGAIISIFRESECIDLEQSGNILQIFNRCEDTNLTNEEVEDIVGGMFTLNSETLITSSYNDTPGTIDLTVEDDLSLYDNSTSGFISSLTKTTSGADFTVSGNNINLPFYGTTNYVKLGYLAGQTGTAMGAEAMRYVTGGGNVAFGYQAMKGQSGLSSGTNNVAIGQQPLLDLTTGVNNVAIGSFAGSNITSGDYNFALGEQACNGVTTGNSNVGIGRWALRATTGSNNVGVGTFAFRTTTSSNNTGIGVQAGENNTGTGNTFIGVNAGRSSGSSSNSVYIGINTGNTITRSNTLAIDNSTTSTPLIYGEFDNNKIAINGELEVTDLTGGSAVGGIAYDATNQLVSTDLPISDLQWQQSGTSARLNDQDGNEIVRISPDAFHELDVASSTQLTLKKQTNYSEMYKSSQSLTAGNTGVDFSNVINITNSDVTGDVTTDEFTTTATQQVEVILNGYIQNTGSGCTGTLPFEIEILKNGTMVRQTKISVLAGLDQPLQFYVKDFEPSFLNTDDYSAQVFLPTGCTATISEVVFSIEAK